MEVRMTRKPSRLDRISLMWIGVKLRDSPLHDIAIQQLHNSEHMPTVPGLCSTPVKDIMAVMEWRSEGRT
ncbi:hypothetical protein DOTSEDRAFT_44833 [Dothistroma septosporum NZE10]|uniref:Uncharacterized protein n=1 Tax=Dothistroma septosporum (strain NZE10 / CBS 128990) TaxID=675120 RepID=N1PQQ8_DOTSN|nr:hypothetical protein DOTSEDRAFT_44833 [Dothistroma septosporum NZE10]